ncbi:MFS transporter [Enterococcus sp. AZ109]|uniref:MFS transporter n=1 Tax=Enterococcus sp. AZ109 TaxID=2774634 RepID=UPI003F1E4EEE
MEFVAEEKKVEVGKVVPIILFLMVFSLVIDNSFKIISPELVKYFGVSASTVSWQVTLAGLFIGMGAVVYASLADSVSIRTLLVIGIGLICVGSLMGYLVHESYWLVVLARVIQASGLGATETLYLIFIAKYVEPEKQKKYMGYSTSSFQIATVIGTLTGGFITTHLAWQHLFIIPLFTLLCVPFILKYLPKEESTKRHIDVLGMILVAAVSTSIMMYLSYFDWRFFVVFVIAIGLFLAYITKSKTAFITIEFFKNKLFVFVLLTAFLLYSTQSAYTLNAFSFFMVDVYHIGLDSVSAMFIPACLAAALVGSLSGKISEKLSSEQCIYVAMGLIIVNILGSALFMGQSILIFIISLVLTSCSFAMLYAPMIHMSLLKVGEEHKGTALGFYNLCINVAMSVGFTYSSFFIDNQKLQVPFIAGGTEAHYSAVLMIIAFIAFLSLAVFVVFARRQLKVGK